MPKVLYPFLYENLGIYWIDLKEIWVVYVQHKLVRFNSGIREKHSFLYKNSELGGLFFIDVDETSTADTDNNNRLKIQLSKMLLWYMMIVQIHLISTLQVYKIIENLPIFIWIYGPSHNYKTAAILMVRKKWNNSQHNYKPTITTNSKQTTTITTKRRRRAALTRLMGAIR